MESNLTPAQASNYLGITKRTLRRWSAAFESSLSEPARQHGRKRFYSGEDIATLEHAQRYIAEGKSLSEVAEQLPVITPDDKPTALVLAPEVHAAIIHQSDRTDTLEEQQTGMQSDFLAERDATRESVAELRAEIERLKWQALPWHKRIGKKPPE